jgi:hypothetical protein
MRTVGSSARVDQPFGKPDVFPRARSEAVREGYV